MIKFAADASCEIQDGWLVFKTAGLSMIEGGYRTRSVAFRTMCSSHLDDVFELQL
jgi:hypothetical protein